MIKVQDQIEITGAMDERYRSVLTDEAVQFLTALDRNFDNRRRELLRARELRQQAIDAGQMPDFLRETAEIRRGQWTVAPIPADLRDRRVEITGPVDRKMIINALNSGASVFMADFEDSNSPTWRNNIDGQINLRDAVRRTIEFDKPRRQALPAERKPGHADGAPARLAPGGEALPGGRPADLRLACSISASSSSTTPATLMEQRHRPVLLPAQAGEPPRGAPVERRLRLRPGRISASRAAPSAPRC